MNEEEEKGEERKEEEKQSVARLRKESDKLSNDQRKTRQTPIPGGKQTASIFIGKY